VFAIYVHLNSTGPAPFEVPNPKTFKAATDVRWINGLWFTSLTLSLAVSLLAILAKQWLNEFKSRMRAPSSSPKMWAMRHSAYKGGLERWGMDTFISALPLLLHAALFSFLTGLCLLLIPLDNYIVGTVIGITAMLAVFYVACGIAPLFWADCPTATQMLRYLYSVWREAVEPASRKLILAVYFLYCCLIFAIFHLLGMVVSILMCPIWILLSVFSCCDLTFDDESFVEDCVVYGPVSTIFLPHLWRKEKEQHGRFFSWQDERPAPKNITQVLRYRNSESSAPVFDQARILSRDEPLREASILAWMIRSLPADDDIQAALCAAGWLPAGTHVDYFQKRRLDSPLDHEDICRAAVDTINSISLRADAADDEMTVSIVRACLFLGHGRFFIKEFQYFPGPASSQPTEGAKQLILDYMNRYMHDPRLLSLAACHVGGALSPATACHRADIDTRTVELIALSRWHGRTCPLGITLVVFNALAALRILSQGLS